MSSNILKAQPLYIKELLTGNVIPYDSRYKASKHYGVSGASISNCILDNISANYINSNRGVLLASTTNTFSQIKGVEIIDHRGRVLTFCPMFRYSVTEISRALSITIEQAKEINDKMKQVGEHPEFCFVPSGKAVCLKPTIR
jgi:hypothetical protein